jgi:hypothetical protein
VLQLEPVLEEDPQMNHPAGTEKPRSWKATNDTTNSFGGARHGLIAGHPPLHGGGKRRKLARLDETVELLAGHVGARPVRHRCGGVSCGLEAQDKVVSRMRESSENGMRAQRKKITGKQSPEPAPDAWFQKGKRGPSSSTSGPPCQRNVRPRARLSAKQAPTHATP